MTTQLSIGVIGHVDHGKTSLVRALTGIDTDRLKEEKERGMSIVLGFAYLEIEGGVIDLIDVPGHENFIRTMVSGATGIDAALLVVDAHEGVKPQTLEHLAITELLGIRRGIIAITKSDLVDYDTKAVVLRRVRSVLKQTCFEFAPIVYTSSTTGEGLDALRCAIQGLLVQCAPETASDRFMLPIDRVFSIAGRGTVVTGTLRLGRLKVGDEVEIMPNGVRAIVRRIEVHGREVALVNPGQRAGVNLRHIKANEVARGDTLGSVGLLRASSLLDAQVSILKGQQKTLRNTQSVRLLFGTTDVVATPRNLERASIEPGHSGLVQFRTQRPVSSLPGEPFIVRSDTPAMTIGGGQFLDAAPVRHRRTNHAAMERLQVLAGGSGDEILVAQLIAAGYGGIAASALATRLNKREADVMKAAAGNEAVVINGTTLLHRAILSALGDRLDAALSRYHQRYPLRLGAPLSYCRASIPPEVSESLFKFLLRTLSESKRIAIGNGMVRLSGHDPIQALDEADRKRATMMESRFRTGGTTPPDIADVIKGDARREDIFYMLVERGNLLSLSAGQAGQKIAFHKDVIKEVDQSLIDTYPPPAQFSVSEARALLGSTRKFMIPLLEYFDGVGYTRRRGDKRMIVSKSERRR